ncbi:PAP/25A associated domain family [Taphrina deformans PYCC 5710]|uniref:polynucleotide adenylyltransferase n=1 Tax=Taphrina deformans (strain PYCC 5710 / ATCC 11124 / CBS 356.35 / IMI 108563 / JCM 9778 / NBRC 8474) TaxID=1097556 RepID=R4XDJ2_TAPDE|nr:PAP/25A associated domain family [Taphrina deformans PYCC 5710]|eukprot:CCG83661.1 PAP/25A associated domain family [Taphrina deformans PYCC 5710]
MARCGMQNVVCRAQAKVPVVAIYDPELKIACDMNINNTLALRNTRLVRTYMQLDERARQLTFAIKHWAANRALNEAAYLVVCNTLTSYTWTLMVINYLQTRRVAPILPSLQEWPHEPVPRINGLDVSFADDVDKYDTLQTFSLQNQESVGALLFGFFHHYAYEFNYHRDVASVRLGTIITRHEKGFSNDNMICIEEPFTISRNLGNTADVGSHRGIHQELQRAHLMLAEGEPISSVFAKYEASKEVPSKPESLR